MFQPCMQCYKFAIIHENEHGGGKNIVLLRLFAGTTNKHSKCYGLLLCEAFDIKLATVSIFF